MDIDNPNQSKNVFKVPRKSMINSKNHKRLSNKISIRKALSQEIKKDSTDSQGI